MKLCTDGKISFICYVSAAFVAGMPKLLSILGFNAYPHDIFRSTLFIHVFQFAVLNVILILACGGFAYQVWSKLNYKIKLIYKVLIDP